MTLDAKIGNYGLNYPRISANDLVSKRDLDTLQVRGGYSGSDAERSGTGFSGIDGGFMCAIGELVISPSSTRNAKKTRSAT